MDIKNVRRAKVEDLFKIDALACKGCGSENVLWTEEVEVDSATWSDEVAMWCDECVKKETDKLLAKLIFG